MGKLHMTGSNKTFLQQILALFMLIGMSGIALADLKAEVDRTEIRENESLQLTVTSTLEVSSTLDLFSLNSLSIPQPDISAVEDDFEILDRRQSYRVQIENNQNNSVITWDYTLLPKHSGEVVIPAIEYEGNKSTPIPIKVVAASQNIPNQQKDVFLESEIDRSEAYVQQQVIYKVRLYYSQDLIRGELEHPDHPDALFKQIGKQKEYSRYVGSRRFNVIERQYVLFPQKAGELEIPPLQFTGTLLERRIGRRIYSKESAPAVKIQVKAPPASFSGKTWLPAQSLNIRDVWSDPGREMNTGDSLTRTISLQALGLEGVQLPPLTSPDLDGLKVYPEPDTIDSDEHAAGVTGKREETQAVVALRPGVYTLPEVRIPWWDVVNDEERVAILPSRTITVSGAPTQNTTAAQTTPPQTPVATPGTSASSPAPSATSGVTRPIVEDDVSPFWQILSAVFFLLWILTLWAWWKKPGMSIKEKEPAVERPKQATTLQQLERFAAIGDPRFVEAFLQWLQQQKASGKLSGKECDALNTDIRDLLNQIQRLHYGQNTGAESHSDNTKITELASQILTHAKTVLAQSEERNSNQLQPLYPAG
ncbi:BatD family protein [Hahella sp. CCB-MM4]|uniref:BatD family protein n=1 Tax=Hahella sp. (strain CCB-MM4) TaxID=1926491 RepID=UPI001FEF9950|nr:BatD family protein [Hahella sp. CCB-MM4]